MELEQGKQYIVIGLGASGMAAIRYLHGLGLNVSVSEFRSSGRIDASELEGLRQLGIPFEIGGHTWDFIKKADLIIPSPGVPLTIPVLEKAREEGIAIAGELALAAGRFSVPVIGVTGSNGKTTVTSLIGHLLRADGHKVFVGGNIGTPLLDYLQGERDAEVVVLELSSFQLEISGDFRPDIGLFLNVSPDHLDRHGAMDNYVSAKRRIFTHQGPGDIAILGADDAEIMREPVITAGTVLRFGFQPDFEACLTEQGVSIAGPVQGVPMREDYDLTDTLLSSQVNRLNAAAAILAVRALSCKPDAIREGLAGYTPPEHRMILVREMDGVRYVDDSKATNIGAVAAALSSSANQVILIGGGRDKGSDFALLRPFVEKHVKGLVLIGESADRMEEVLGSLVRVYRAESLEEAVKIAAETAQPGDIVLLSPGCASFDMFTSYAHRGQVFQEAVHKLCRVNQGCC